MASKRPYTNNQAGELLGLGVTQVKQWRKRGILVEFPDGTLDVESTLSNANRMLNPTVGGRPDRQFGGRLRPVTSDTDIDLDPGAASIAINPSDPAAMIAAKTRIAIEDAKFKALRNAEKEGALVPMAMAVEMFGDAMALIRSTLTSWPVRWRHRFVGMAPDEIEKIIRADVETILKELSNGLAADKLARGDRN